MIKQEYMTHRKWEYLALAFQFLANLNPRNSYSSQQF